MTLEGVNACWREGIACDLSAVSQIKSSKLQQGKCRSDFSKKTSQQRRGRSTRESACSSPAPGDFEESWINAGQEGLGSLVLPAGDGRRLPMSHVFPSFSFYDSQH